MNNSKGIQIVALLIKKRPKNEVTPQIFIHIYDLALTMRMHPFEWAIVPGDKENYI